MLKSQPGVLVAFAESILLICCHCFGDNLSTGRNVQIDALNAKTAILMVGEKKLYSLNLDSGAASLITESKFTWFAVDRRSQTVLVATRSEGGTDLQLYHLDHGLMVPGAKAFLRLAIAELQSMKFADVPTYLVSGCDFPPKGLQKDEEPYWVHLAVSSPVDGTLMTTPVPGLSEISSLLACGTIGFAGDAQGTFAYAGRTSKTSLRAADDSVQHLTHLPGGADLFMIVSGGRVRNAWPVSFPSATGGRVIGFTPDAQTLLAHVSIAESMFGDHDTGFKLINLKTGKLTPWVLGRPFEVIAVDETMTRPIFQMRYVIPAPGTPADAPLVTDESEAAHTKYRWRAELVEEHKSPVKLLDSDEEDVEMGGTFIDGEYFVTDGANLGVLDRGDKVRSISIGFGK